MPAPAHPIPARLPPLQLYRHLLRECSYLPPAFRATIAETIKDRFHRHHKHDPRAKAHLSRALSTLRTLRAANTGDKAAMEGLMLKGFGRTGSRRRELMSKFVISQGPKDSKALEALSRPPTEGHSGKDDMAKKDKHNTPAGVPKVAKKAFYDKWDQPKLLQLLQSQRQQQKDTKGTTSWPFTAVKSLDPNQFVPKTNIWGKPPAESLLRSKRSHWWRRSADKIMPPLGKGEWDILGGLCSGLQETAEWMVPERRSPARTLAEDTTGNVWAWTEYAMKPVAAVERQKSVSKQRRSGEIEQGPYSAKKRSQTISARWFQRAYSRVWQLTPTMSQNPNKLQNSIAWGNAESKVAPATEHQLEIFQGVDKKGHKSRSDQSGT